MNSPTTVPGKRGSRWTLVFVLLLVPLVLCGGLASWWFGRSAIAQAELDARVEQLRAKGMPVDDASLAEYHRQLTDETHAETWAEILAVLDSPAATNASRDLPLIGIGPEIPPPTEPWPEKDEVQAFLDTYRATIDDLHRVARSDRPVRFPVEFESFDTLLPNVHAMRRAARVLTLEHHVALHDSDSEADFRALNSLIGTSLALRGEPLLVSQLVSTALHGVAIGAIKDSVEADILDAEQIETLMNRLKVFEDFATPLRIGLAGERAMALPLFADPGRMTQTGAASALGSRPIDALAYLDWIEQTESLPTDDLDSFVTEADRVGERVTHLMESAGFLRQLDTVMTRMTLPAVNAFARALARQVMGNRMTRLGLGIRRFEKEQGRFPESLDELSQVGLDVPRTCRGFRLRFTDPTFVQ